MKTLKKQIEEDDPCLQIGRTDTVKMATLWKLTYRLNAKCTKISTQFFTEIEKVNFSFIWKYTPTCTPKKTQKSKNLRMAKTYRTIQELPEVSPTQMLSGITEL